MTRKFTGITKSLIATIAGAALLSTLACGGELATSGPATVPAAVQPPAPAVSHSVPTPQSALEPATSVAGVATTSPAPSVPKVSAQETSKTGIRTSGQGQASGSPDIAILNLAVESFAGSVAEARNAAAASMDQIVSTLREAGVEERDIRTSHFDISPHHTQREVARCITKTPSDTSPETPPAEPECFMEWESVITGYRVSNGLSVQVRNLEGVSDLIDQVIAAGGDLIRFHGVNFVIEDTSALEEQARAAAVADMQEKARQLASSSGVNLGRIVFLQEVGDSYAYRPKFSVESFAVSAAADVATPIMPGEQTITVTVEGFFAIE